jgi:hypothetical protein
MDDQSTVLQAGTTQVANGKLPQSQNGSPAAGVADDIVLVGSIAAQMGGMDLGHANDQDFICTREAFDRLVSLTNVREVIPTRKGIALRKEGIITVIQEFEFVDGNPVSESLLRELVGNRTNAFYTLGLQQIPVACLDDLYMLKESHKYLRNSPHFLKTRQDILKFRERGCKILNEELFKAREKDTYNYSHPNLKQNKQDFFTDEVDYTYDHDSIHEAMKHLSTPAYQKYAVEGEEVLSSKEKFFDQLDIVKLYGVLEEAYVLALERSVIPYASNPDKAFRMALMKICTSITSGWFREYAWENYDKVIELYESDWDYVARFKVKLAQGIVKPFKGE